MTERPIIFSAPMVKAIIDGRKTQTRRVVKEPGWATPHTLEIFNGMPMAQDPFKGDRDIPCPYGQAGDRLWVRETGWERPERTPKMMRDGADTWQRYYYSADGMTYADHEQFKEWGFKRRPSIFMPRWASRITLEVTGVRVERLQSITEDDAAAEGVDWQAGASKLRNRGCESTRDAFEDLWDSINAKRAPWASNPWVWVIEFKRIANG